jgi:hypothetical protein
MIVCGDVFACVWCGKEEKDIKDPKKHFYNQVLEEERLDRLNKEEK